MTALPQAPDAREMDFETPAAASPRLAYLLLAIAPLCMASNVVIGRAAADTVPPVALAFWRWATATALLMPFALPSLWRYRRVLWATAPRVLALGLTGMALSASFVYTGVSHTTAANAGLIYAISPVLIVLIGVIFRGESVNWRQIAGIALAIAGVVVIVTRGDPAYLLDLQVNQGDLWVMGAALSWAIYSVLLREGAVPVPTLPMFAITALAGVVCLAPAYAVDRWISAPIDWTWEAIASVAGVAVISSVLAFGLYQIGIRAVGPARAGVFNYLIPVYAVVLGVAILGETLAVFHGLGLALILPGLLLAGLRRSARLAKPL
ncbi:MAG: EamA family transporter [Rhodospirillaceae bacterium]|nr:EamA family transporter [Rhodospirillaceae bacterium]